MKTIYYYFYYLQYMETLGTSCDTQCVYYTELKKMKWKNKEIYTIYFCALQPTKNHDSC